MIRYLTERELKMALETKIMIIVGIGSGIILGIPFTPIVCLIRHVLIVPFKHKKILEKAKREGHVVKAKLIKATDAPWEGGLKDSSRYIGLYAYEYNNKTYKVHLESQAPIQEELTLYFERNPRRAVRERALGLHESPIILCYMISALIMSAVMTYIGVVYGFGG